MTKKKIGFRDTRAFIELNIAEHGMSLPEAVVDFLDSHEIPIEKLRQYLDQGLFDQLKADLKSLMKNHNHKDKVTIYSFIRHSNMTNKTKKRNMIRIKR